MKILNLIYFLDYFLYYYILLKYIWKTKPIIIKTKPIIKNNIAFNIFFLLNLIMQLMVPKEIINTPHKTNIRDAASVKFND